ncbi:CRISPR-associated helicase Cas3' [Scopulibacillus cellulosilyticus]|uniref:CRISPR-associated helicase Cas3 n=1 Tax=Scopulibacillus cellulosilyticus TaxID=2665665 RepID=A0ABW2PXY5_9BACL
MIYAKSDPIETLYEHTEELKKRLVILKKAYGKIFGNERLWKVIQYAVQYHDAGKVYSPFQNRICKTIGENIKNDSELPYIPHNYLSPFFVPYSQLNLTDKEIKVLIQSITYHHERNQSILKKEIKRALKEDLMHNQSSLSEHLQVFIPEKEENIFKTFGLMINRIKSGDDTELYLQYILVKGLLHRLDHAASAHVEIESDVDYDLAEMTEKYIITTLNKKDAKVSELLRPVQIFAKKNQNKNLIIVAQTGMGKTEAALLWAGKKKTFFTLPLRVSLNALYDRVKDQMGFKGTGLLHSSSASHLTEKGEEDWEIIRDQSKHLSSKLLFTTIDQILKFPMKYRGYEKYYATMAYSAVIIDEIQAYDPKIAAFLIKAIEMIHQIGGKFMIMTATLPTIYKEELIRRGVLNLGDYLYGEFVNDITRHRIQLQNEKIDNATNEIAKIGQEKKVLVIVNTVKKALEVYQQLKKKHVDNVRLLHSMFVQKHRSMLENDILAFDKRENEPGIWVTTQLVEASVDIDFDVLFTEMSTLDSLFQRLGRCYRKRELDHDGINVNIYTREPSGRKYIYDEDIMDLSVEALLPYNKNILREKDKVQLVKDLYCRKHLPKQFLKQFDQALNEIDNFPDYYYDNNDAQKLLRDIQSELVIPSSLYYEHLDLFKLLTNEENPDKRAKLRREIEKYTVSLRKSKTRGLVKPIPFIRNGKDGKNYPVISYIKILDLPYDFDEKETKGFGVQPSKSIEESI